MREFSMKKKLTPEEYQICRLKGTEAPFTGKYWNCKQAGTYLCTCCGNPLFSSRDKYDSGTGWPSFDRPLTNQAVKEIPDSSHGMERTEVVCQVCGAHLGHVFSDGPPTTGLRYCINSVSLNLEENSARREKKG
jgi:peptide-methionine (R)-S-oxide reductase